MRNDSRQRQPQHDTEIETATVDPGVGDYVNVSLVVSPLSNAGSRVLKDHQSVTINATANESVLTDVFTPMYTT